ncbi:unnamed protein product, partial [Adineta steineri]
MPDYLEKINNLFHKNYELKQESYLLQDTYFNQQLKSKYGRVGNPNVNLEDDCALRAFTIEMAGYIAPSFWKSKWTALSESAFQMDECNETKYPTYQS